jgi:hypothetical protein
VWTQSGPAERLLRLLDSTSLFSNAYADDVIAAISKRREHRADARPDGCCTPRLDARHWVRSVWPRRQVDEVVCGSTAGLIRPFSRCAD